MLKKEEVYVRVSSEKKARKLKEILDMFGQKVYICTYAGLCHGIDLYGDSQIDYPYILIDDDNEWCGFSEVDETKTKVSLKELRNILAREYLKDGDVVLTKKW